MMRSKLQKIGGDKNLLEEFKRAQRKMRVKLQQQQSETHADRKYTPQ